MPEGPSIVILKDQLKPFKNKCGTEASGHARNVDRGL